MTEANREIMRIYKDLDMVEQLGSEMNRILLYYKRESFVFYDNFLKMVFISNYKERDLLRRVSGTHGYWKVLDDQ